MGWPKLTNNVQCIPEIFIGTRIFSIPLNFCPTHNRWVLAPCWTTGQRVLPAAKSCWCLVSCHRVASMIWPQKKRETCCISYTEMNDTYFLARVDHMEKLLTVSVSHPSVKVWIEAAIFFVSFSVSVPGERVVSRSDTVILNGPSWSMHCPKGVCFCNVLICVTASHDSSCDSPWERLKDTLSN